ncbi:MAG: thiamine phosphate synthase [Acinetobacter populi]|jgi:thiamine-phosphate pyrophosphorylase|uniref:thiamine phosphate synthase n=1 Tax=Acinetobacter populi TaxID=1582270 RepID=UPI002353574C|nr:thiamine phosphate synthase [Acinetobacter populi]MCH4247800.1 thiamine phosphate synthase [Acinetobacter populi]
MQGLYLITNDDPFVLLLQKLQAALATRKVALLQYRRKKVAKADQTQEIEQILKLCNQYAVPLIINDDLDQARQFGVHVHLGQDDGSIQHARQVLGKDAIIGRTCLNSLQLAEQAIADGASYVAFGAVYATITKPEAGNVGIAVIQQAKQELNVPICAIGGLTVENSQVVIDAGASLCAVVSDILGLAPKQIPGRVDAWAKLFQ